MYRHDSCHNFDYNVNQVKQQLSRTPCKSSRCVSCMPKVFSSNVVLICNFYLFLLKLCRITELGIPNNRMCLDFRFHWFLVGHDSMSYTNILTAHGSVVVYSLKLVEFIFVYSAKSE